MNPDYNENRIMNILLQPGNSNLLVAWDRDIVPELERHGPEVRFWGDRFMLTDTSFWASISTDGRRACCHYRYESAVGPIGSWLPIGSWNRAVVRLASPE